jgi:hypothetical protein
MIAQMMRTPSAVDDAKPESAAVLVPSAGHPPGESIAIGNTPAERNLFQ